MVTDKKTFFIGLFIFITPFLGLPLWWRFTLIILSALSLIIFSIKLELSKKTSSKSLKLPRKKQKITENKIISAEKKNKENDDIIGQ